MISGFGRALSILILVLAAIGPADAQDCAAIEQQGLIRSYADALRDLLDSGCLGAGKNPDHSLVKSFNLLTENVGDASDKRVANTRAANGLLQGFATDQSSAAIADRDIWAQIALVLAGQSIAMDSAANAASPESALAIVESALDPDQWEVFSGSGRVLALPDRSTFSDLDALCAGLGPDADIDCGAYKNRKVIILVILLAKDLTGYSTRERMFLHLAESRIANKKWDAYFNDAHFQWWWEVWANGQLMLRNDCNKNDATQMREGFCDVPDSQLILFHPDIALSYVDGASSSDDLKGAFLVEILGRNQWDWSADGTMQNARGWSVVAAYSNLSDQDDWGYGLMYHYRNRFSLGLTSTEGDIGVLLSVDLSDKLFERKAKYNGYLQELEKPSFWKEVFTRN